MSTFYLVADSFMAWLEGDFVRRGAFDIGWYQYFFDLFTFTGRAYALAVLLPSLAVSARRLHDSGRSAWWVLLIVVPVVGFVALIALYCVDGEPGDNRYGPGSKRDPLESSKNLKVDAGVRVR